MKDDGVKLLVIAGAIVLALVAFGGGISHTGQGTGPDSGFCSRSTPAGC